MKLLLLLGLLLVVAMVVNGGHERPNRANRVRVAWPDERNSKSNSSANRQRKRNNTRTQSQLRTQSQREENRRLRREKGNNGGKGGEGDDIGVENEGGYEDDGVSEGDGGDYEDGDDGGGDDDYNEAIDGRDGDGSMEGDGEDRLPYEGGDGIDEDDDGDDAGLDDNDDVLVEPGNGLDETVDGLDEDGNGLVDNDDELDEDDDVLDKEDVRIDGDGADRDRERGEETMVVKVNSMVSSAPEVRVTDSIQLNTEPTPGFTKLPFPIGKGWKVLSKTVKIVENRNKQGCDCKLLARQEACGTHLPVVPEHFPHNVGMDPCCAQCWKGQLGHVFNRFAKNIRQGKIGPNLGNTRGDQRKYPGRCLSYNECTFRQFKELEYSELYYNKCWMKCYCMGYKLAGYCIQPGSSECLNYNDWRCRCNGEIDRNWLGLTK